jgi:hypothetical protein
MICSVKPVLTEDLCEVQKKDIFNKMLCDTYTWRKAKHIHKRQTHWMLHKDYDRKVSVGGKNISGRDPQGAWREDELNGDKPPVVKQLTLTLWPEACL